MPFAEGLCELEASQNSQNSPAKGLTALGEAHGTGRGDLSALARFWCVVFREPGAAGQRARPGRAEELPPPSSWAPAARPAPSGEATRATAGALKNSRNEARRRPGRARALR